MMVRSSVSFFAPLAAVVAVGFFVCCCIISKGAGSNLRRTELVSRPQLSGEEVMNLRERSILAVAKQLHHDKVSKALSVRAAKAFSTISLACSGSGSKDAAAMDRYRKRADTNWWAAIHAFATADEVQKAAFNDPRHVHLLIYVAPGWCGWSQKQLKELQENFDDLGEAQARVHLIDVDDPANKDLVQFQGVTSFPTIVVVQGNNILGKASGYKTFNTVHDIAFVDNDGVPN